MAVGRSRTHPYFWAVDNSAANLEEQQQLLPRALAVHIFPPIFSIGLLSTDLLDRPQLRKLVH